ncbi:MAG: filamentous hemagglutinin family outer rane protein [Magnetococcales bacterium]|nr:filamentous hemagglutinin family outer rane protein [Magnetococcales bacterium]
MNNQDLKYVPNPKHKEPWQKGRKGALCPKWSHSLAQELLLGSESHPGETKKSRYATHNGLAFKAYPDHRGGWHGYPVGWDEVPVKISNKWLREGLIQLKDIKKFKLLKMDAKGNVVEKK